MSGVDGGAGGEAGRQVAHQVAGAEREADPAAGEPDAAVARPHLEVVAEQAAQVGEHGGVGGRVQPVAAVVDPQPGDGAARRHPADDGRPGRRR